MPSQEELSLRSREHFDRACGALAVGRTGDAAESLAEVIVGGTDHDRQLGVEFLQAYTAR